MNTILGNRIRSLREAKGFTQEQIADKLNCSRQKYARLEKGLTDISYSSIKIIAEALGIKTDEITSSVDDISHLQPVFRTKADTTNEEHFEFIKNMIDTFYAHRRLYNSIRQVDCID